MLDESIVTRPSLWKRLLIASTLSVHTFNDNNTPWPFTFFNQYTQDWFYLWFIWIFAWFDPDDLDIIAPFTLTISGLALLFVATMYIQWCHNHIGLFLLLALALAFWPVMLLLLIGIVGFLALLLFYFPVRGLLMPLATLCCRDELPYYRVRNQARIDAKVQKIIEDTKTPKHTLWGVVSKRDVRFWDTYADAVKKYSSEY